jgi:tetratricopeptide (TPR) repeat protein
LLPHVRVLLDHAFSIQLTTEPLASLLTRAGNYLSARGSLKSSQELHERALAINKRLHASDHSSVAWSLSNLAVNLRGLGEPARARELDEQALAMRQRLFEGDHPDVARSLINLAADFRRLGEAARARELAEQGLAMRRRLKQAKHSKP